MDKYENYLEDDIPIPEASYAYLCEAGFVKINQKSMKVTIVWDLEVSKYKQVFLLKKIYPNV